MRPPIALIAVVVFVTATTVSQAEAQGRTAAPRPVAITHVTVIDVEHGRRLRDHTIIVEGGRISTIGPSALVRVPDGYGVVEARGKFVIPGLIDTDVPLLENRANPAVPDSARPSLELFVPFGVTTIREAGGLDADRISMAWRLVRDTVGVPIPRIKFSSGVGDNPDYPLDPALANVDGVIRLEAIRPLGRNRRPDSPPVDTTDWAAPQLYRDAEWLYEDTAVTDSLIRLMVKRRVRLEPTLVREELMFLGAAELVRHPGARFSRIPIDHWRARYPSPIGVARERARESVNAMTRFVRRFRDAGGIVVAGTNGRPFSGAGIHDELRLLVQAGLTPLEALRAATFDAARTLRWDDRIGTVAVGKLADLLILGADPLLDVANASRIEAIMLDGRFIDGAERQRLLDRLASR